MAGISALESLCPSWPKGESALWPGGHSDYAPPVKKKKKKDWTLWPWQVSQEQSEKIY